ncbi:MAG: glycosyltransferase family 4 protein [Patescibacteria group bacterium]|jgi:glycosyltransferase involved in cell wall biosynthesis
MRIAIDARELANPHDGKSRYVYELVHALLGIDQENEYVLYVWAKPKGTYPETVTFVELPKLPGLRFLWVAWDLWRRRADVFVSPTGYHPVIFSPVPSVLVVHDLAVLVEPRARPAWKTRLMEQLGLPVGLRRAHHIITVSESTKRDVLRLFPFTRGRVTAIPLAPFPLPEHARSIEAVRARHKLPASYVLFVGTLEPRKNVDGLIVAYLELPAELRAKYPLVLGGRRGWNTEGIVAALDRADETVRELGPIDGADLPGLFGGATVFAYPSWYEGFGLPAIEAMRAGVPVVTSATSSLPEVVGDAALTVDPGDTTALTAALQTLLERPALRTQLAAAGKRQAETFSWQQTAEVTLAVLRRVAR